jgi:hypothetical protein
MLTEEIEMDAITELDIAKLQNESFKALREY